MGNIHQFVPRSTQARGMVMSEPADIIIFPGVRFERNERIGEGGAGAGKVRRRVSAKRALTKDD